MNLGTYPLAAHMVNQLNRIDTVANNLANINTHGFKQDHISEGSFNYYLTRTSSEQRGTTKYTTTIDTIPKIDHKFVTKELGAITPTNNDLDFALRQEEVFFKVQNPKTKEVFLTRDGAFKNLNGFLVNHNGFNVLDIDNAVVAIDGHFAPQIGIIKTPFENLYKVANNNFKVKSNNRVEQINDNQEIILQGALEKSNVNSVMAMVKLIESHRRFEQSQRALTGIDSINKELITKVGRV
jgi:flagellar basal-body rod protein FlgG